MTVAHEHEELHHLVDRLPPAQARRLLVLVAADPELAQFVGPSVTGEEVAEDAVSDDRLSWIGMVNSGRRDGAERHDD